MSREAIWNNLKTSFDIHELTRFAESFVGTLEGFEARTRIAQLSEYYPVWDELRAVHREQFSSHTASSLLERAKGKAQRLISKWRGTDLARHLASELDGAQVCVQELAKQQKKAAAIEAFTNERRAEWEALPVVLARGRARKIYYDLKEAADASRKKIGLAPQYSFGSDFAGIASTVFAGLVLTIPVTLFQLATVWWISLPVLALVFWPITALILYAFARAVHGMRLAEAESAEQAAAAAEMRQREAVAAADQAREPFQRAVDDFASTL